MTWRPWSPWQQQQEPKSGEDVLKTISGKSIDYSFQLYKEPKRRKNICWCKSQEKFILLRWVDSIVTFNDGNIHLGDTDNRGEKMGTSRKQWLQ